MGKALPADCRRAHTCPSKQMSPWYSHMLTDRIPRPHTSTSLSAGAILHSLGQFLGTLHPSGHPTYSLARGPTGTGRAGVTPASGVPTCAGALRSRPGPRGESAGEGSPVGLYWRGLAAAAAAGGGGGEREGKGEGKGGRRRVLREAQGLSQARLPRRESTLCS